MMVPETIKRLQIAFEDLKNKLNVILQEIYSLILYLNLILD